MGNQSCIATVRECMSAFVALVYPYSCHAIFLGSADLYQAEMSPPDKPLITIYVDISRHAISCVCLSFSGKSVCTVVS